MRHVAADGGHRAERAVPAMETLTHEDTGEPTAPDGRAAGLLLAVGSSLAFALSGSLARGLFETGWSPGAVVLIRISIGALVVLPLGLVSLAGRW